MSEQSPHSVENRRHLLDNFSERPTDPELWEQAYALVRAEGDTVTDDGTAAALIPAEELITYADTMRATPQADRYALTVERNSIGERWFDTLRTFGSAQNERARLEAIQGIYGRGHHFNRALDIGTGTGKSLAVLESVAGEVIGLDRNPRLLEVAKEVKAPTTQLVQAEVTALPFDDESFDLIASAGLASALDKEATTSFYKQLSRVLTPAGIYVEVSWYSNEDGSEGKEMRDITRTAKATLADMIVDSTSGNLQLTSHLQYGEERDELLASLGLQEHLWTIEDPVYNDGSRSIITAFQKQLS